MAKQVGVIVNGFAPDGSVDNVRAITRALDAYAKLIEPWAETVSRFMIGEVSNRNLKAWQAAGKEIGRNLKLEIAFAPTGDTMQRLLRENVGLITSIPLEAAQRVHRLATEQITTGQRASVIRDEILRSEDVAKSRATLIARTEVARSASLLTQARAQFAGSDGYIWRTSQDFDVRHSHAEMEGKYVRWNQPPRLSDGTRTHAGQIFNCRCYPEPVIPND